MLLKLMLVLLILSMLGLKIASKTLGLIIKGFFLFIGIMLLFHNAVSNSNVKPEKSVDIVDNGYVYEKVYDDETIDASVNYEEPEEIEELNEESIKETIDDCKEIKNVFENSIETVKNSNFEENVKKFVKNN